MSTDQTPDKLTAEQQHLARYVYEQIADAGTYQTIAHLLVEWLCSGESYRPVSEARISTAARPATVPEQDDPESFAYPEPVTGDDDVPKPLGECLTELADLHDKAINELQDADKVIAAKVVELGNDLSTLARMLGTSLVNNDTWPSPATFDVLSSIDARWKR